MSYYRGDFRPGYGHGFQRGDPGFLSSFGHILGGVAKTAISYYTGGALGGLGSSGGVGAATPMPGGSSPLDFYQPSNIPRAQVSRGRMAAPRMKARTPASMGNLPSGMRAPSGMRMRRGGRRMNVCNARALRRAIRRARGFEKLALKSIRLVSPQRLKHKHFGGFKTSRKRK